jgi:hypothetical protein
MKLVNETGQKVAYWIQSTAGGPNCGEIDVDGVADRPDYDNQTNVYVGFNTIGTDVPFTITCGSSGTGQQVEMALIVELGDQSAGQKANQ